MLSAIEKRELQESIKKKFISIFQGPGFKNNLGLVVKADQSPVTEIDLFISEEIKKKLKAHSDYAHYHFFSEEDQESFAFPCTVLDPIDGTRELVRGYPETAVSLALMKSPSEGWAWIYNPFTGFSLSSDELFCPAPQTAQDIKTGLTSRSEWEKGLYPQSIKGKLHVLPRGSIAFKLGLLAAGSCDFVVTKRGKNIWDIAAGTLLCAQRGIYLYQGKERLTELKDKRLNGPLYWCKPEDQELVLDFLS